jgi:hypothetical protein
VHHVAGAADDVGVVLFDLRDESGDCRRLVLLVAVHRDEPVEVLFAGPVEGVLERASVAAVAAVPDHVNGELLKEKRRPVGRAVIDNEHVRRLRRITSPRCTPGWR